LSTAGTTANTPQRGTVAHLENQVGFTDDEFIPRNTPGQPAVGGITAWDRAAAAGPTEAAGSRPAGSITAGDGSLAAAKEAAGSFAAGGITAWDRATAAGPTEAAGSRPVGSITAGDGSLPAVKEAAGSFAAGGITAWDRATAAGPTEAAGSRPVGSITAGDGSLPAVKEGVNPYGEDTRGEGRHISNMLVVLLVRAAASLPLGLRLALGLRINANFPRELGLGLNRCHYRCACCEVPTERLSLCFSLGGGPCAITASLPLCVLHRKMPIHCGRPVLGCGRGRLHFPERHTGVDMCIYICVSMHIYVCIYMNMYIYIHTHTYMYVCIDK